MEGLYPIIRRVRRPLLVVASQRPAAPIMVQERTPTVESASAVPVEVVSQPAASESVVVEPKKERHARKAKEPAAQA